MTGKQFHIIIWYLHVCSLVHQPSPNDNNYSPAYKIRYFQDALENRFNKLYNPGKNLILDESLICAFGRIKFKLIMFTKAACYGIKIYVVTDAETEFFLKVIIYSGTYTYSNNDNTDTLKNMKVVCERCKTFEGSHHTVLMIDFTLSFL